jgi:glycerol-3-phosphate dehydrogenase subunit C
VREGSLEAPTRHPLAWKNPEFWDQAKAEKELERIFDICHGCRRCVSLCTTFPTLFDLVDSSETLEVDGVKKEDYWKVVDQCYLCDLCYMTKCPYVPPHPWNVDFPHVMLRAKAIKFKQGIKFRDRLLSSTDALGKLAAIPVVAQTVNALNGNSLSRAAMQSVLGVHKDRELPPYAPRKFRSAAEKSKEFPVRDGKTTPGKVAIFATCYANYNEPALGHDLAAILEHNQIPYVLVEKEVCCGMPKLELGDLEGVDALWKKNIPVLAKYAREGYAILAPVPSCALMFKQELPLMYPDDADTAAVRDAMFDPFEYFVQRRKDGLLNTDFKQALGKVSYHIPCHSRVQNMGQKTREMLEAIPGTEVTTVERCSGHDGTWGVKTEYFDNSMKIGRPVFRMMAAPRSGNPS